MKPTTEDFLASSARWNGEHHGIRYELNWHGLSEYNPHGTWCYYIIITSEQFGAEDWAKLRLVKEDKQTSHGSFWRHYSYEDFPDLEPHGEWTFGEMKTYLGRDGVEHELVKVGCDYAHLWDRESGYWQGRNEVESHAKHSVDLLVKMFPNRRLRCHWSGKYDTADQFYTAKNGALVHKSQADKIDDSMKPYWLPADQAAA